MRLRDIAYIILLFFKTIFFILQSMVMWILTAISGVEFAKKLINTPKAEIYKIIVEDDKGNIVWCSESISEEYVRSMIIEVIGFFVGMTGDFTFTKNTDYIAVINKDNKKYYVKLVTCDFEEGVVNERRN